MMITNSLLFIFMFLGVGIGRTKKQDRQLMPRRAGTVILTGAALLLTAYLASRVAAPRHTEPVDASTDHRPLGSMYAGSFEERVTLAPAEALRDPETS